LDDAEHDLKKTGVRGWRQIARNRGAWKNPEGGHGPAWTVEPVEKKYVTMCSFVHKH
jgi:hypothetical protein